VVSWGRGAIGLVCSVQYNMFHENNGFFSSTKDDVLLWIVLWSCLRRRLFTVVKGLVVWRVGNDGL
jgi:hypothetical protein